MHAGEEGLAMQRAVEREDVDCSAAQDEVDMNWGEKVEEIFLREAKLTS